MQNQCKKSWGFSICGYINLLTEVWTVPEHTHSITPASDIHYRILVSHGLVPGYLLQKTACCRRVPMQRMGCRYAGSYAVSPGEVMWPPLEGVEFPAGQG